MYIAKRYLISKKKWNIINIISGIAVSGVTIGMIALVVVLSVYNGFNNLIHSMFNSFDPDLKITAVEGKTFDPRIPELNNIEQIEGVDFVASVLQESAIIEYNGARGVVTIKGVSSNYNQVTDLDSLICDGSATLENEGFQYAVVGLGVALNLRIGLNFLDPIRVYAAKKGERVSNNPSQALNRESIFPSGFFNVQEGYDSEYVLVPLDFARKLFDTPQEISSLELKLKPGYDKDKIQMEIEGRVGDKFHVKNKYQQQQLVYKVMNSEKWAIYFILVFILAIASFNIMGSISMLIIDKKDDISILRSIGADRDTINKAFLFEGWLITLSGAILGLILGVLICWAQIHFELLKLPGAGSFAVTAYPVSINIAHLALSFITVIIIGFLVSWIPIRYFSAKYISPKL